MNIFVLRKKKDLHAFQQRRISTRSRTARTKSDFLRLGCVRMLGLLAFSPLSMGVLTGKYLGGARPEGARFTLTNRNAPRYNSEAAQPAVAAYVAIAKKHGIDPAAMAIAFAASRPFVTSAIFGATTLEQLKTNISAGDLILSPEILAEIEDVYKAIPDPAA